MSTEFEEYKGCVHIRRWVSQSTVVQPHGSTEKNFLLEVTGVDILRYKVVAVMHGKIGVGVLFSFSFFCFL